MKQNLAGIPLPVGGWFSIALALSPYILRGIGSQWPETQETMFAIAKVIEKIVTLGLPIDPVTAQVSLAVAGGAALHKTESE